MIESMRIAHEDQLTKKDKQKTELSQKIDEQKVLMARERSEYASLKEDNA